MTICPHLPGQYSIHFITTNSVFFFFKGNFSRKLLFKMWSERVKESDIVQKLTYCSVFISLFRVACTSGSLWCTKWKCIKNDRQSYLDRYFLTEIIHHCSYNHDWILSHKRIEIDLLEDISFKFYRLNFGNHLFENFFSHKTCQFFPGIIVLWLSSATCPSRNIPFYTIFGQICQWLLISSLSYERILFTVG